MMTHRGTLTKARANRPARISCDCGFGAEVVRSTTEPDHYECPEFDAHARREIR